MSTESSKATVSSSAKTKAKGQPAKAGAPKAKNEAKNDAKNEAKNDAKQEAKAIAAEREAAEANEREADLDSDEDSGDAGEVLILTLPRWVRRAIALAAIAVGWSFIAWHNHFYFTPAVVMLGLGWAAAVSTLYFLWRTGAAGAAEEDGAREDWWRLQSAREELEREKRSLLKTIREIEFDQQTGKLSERDAHDMAQLVRVRAIEVMKELDAVEEGGGARAEIARELRARLEIEKARKAGAKPLPKQAPKPLVKASEPIAKPSAAVAKASEAKPEAKLDAKAEAKLDAKAEAKPEAKVDAKLDAKAAPARSETAVNVAAAVDEPAPLAASAAASDEAASAAASDEAPAPPATPDEASAADDSVASPASSSPSSAKGSEVSA